MNKKVFNKKSFKIIIIIAVAVLVIMGIKAIFFHSSGDW